MNKESSKLDQSVERLLKDKEFSKRTASAVVARAPANSNHGRTWLAVAAAGLIGVSVFFWAEKNAEPKRYAGLTEASAAVLASEEQTDMAWEDTDSVIYGTLSAR
ncbi:MAG: hypothetical protein K8S54_16680 [Spirochaetia bacterium]|nr:hypothetical protein [Spirochaetia bacterium]